MLKRGPLPEKTPDSSFVLLVRPRVIEMISMRWKEKGRPGRPGREKRRRKESPQIAHPSRSDQVRSGSDAVSRTSPSAAQMRKEKMESVSLHHYYIASSHHPNAQPLFSIFSSHHPHYIFFPLSLPPLSSLPHECIRSQALAQSPKNSSFFLRWLSGLSRPSPNGPVLRG